MTYKNIKTLQTALLVSLTLVATFSLTNISDAWAFDDYYAKQWEIADKEIIALGGEIGMLWKQIMELEEKLSETTTDDERNRVEKIIALYRDRIDQKTEKNLFLEKEIERLEQLSIESFSVDSATETRLTIAMEKLQNEHGNNTSFYSVLIDFQDEEILVFVHPNSELSVEQLEETINYNATVRLEEGQHGPVGCTSRYSTCSNPLYAGVEVKRNGDSGGPGTLGYYAIHNDGSRGYVIAGHVADFNGASITQPEDGRIIGQVTEYCGQSYSSCDAAFIDLNSNEGYSNRIYKTSSSYYNVIGDTSDSSQTFGTLVRKSGIGSGNTYGTIVGNVEGHNHNTIRFSSGNYVQSGDSGSPVFKQPSTRSNNVYLYGMLVSQASGGQYGIYHPQDFVANQLNLQ